MAANPAAMLLTNRRRESCDLDLRATCFILECVLPQMRGVHAPRLPVQDLSYRTRYFFASCWIKHRRMGSGVLSACHRTSRGARDNDFKRHRDLQARG